MGNLVENSVDLKRELKDTVQAWVDRSFNFIPKEVVERFISSDGQNNLFEYIRQIDKSDAFDEWLADMDEENVWNNYFESNDIDVLEYESIEDAKSSNHEEFKDWCLNEYEDDIQEFVDEKENYPVWNTLFEFRDSHYNYEEQIQKCLKVGVGVIEGLDPFNTMIFMTTAGHDFYSEYWIPLYLEIYESERERFKGVKF